MNSFLFYFILVPVIVIALLALNLFFAQSKPNEEKLSTFECGFSPVEQARQKFSVHFYLVGILFLVFDLEVLLLFPAAVSMYSIAQSGFWILLFFLVVLTIGFVYEYASGALNYANKEKDSELPPTQVSIFIKNPLDKGIYYKHGVRNYSSFSKNEFKDFWLNIKPISEWYNLDKNGYSKAYINKYNSQNGIYIFRLIEEPWKCYVGSAESFSKRLISHKWAFTHFINSGNSSVPLFYNGVKKYGWEAFQIAILELVPISELSNRENHYLSFRPYYNLKYSIDGKVQHSDEVRAQISLSVLGENNPFFGRVHSEISKNNMVNTKFLSKNELIGEPDYLKALDSLKLTSLSKTIYQFSKDRELINTFPSLSLTALYFKSDRSTIRKYLNKNTLFGNQWYLTTNLNFDSEQQINSINKSNLEWSSLTPVYQYQLDKDNIKLINSFLSISDAAFHLEVSIFTIRRYIKSQKIFKDQYLLSKDDSLDNSSNNNTLSSQS
jgi:NADH-ubiquinone oxidoreductase chain 3